MRGRVTRWAVRAAAAVLVATVVLPGPALAQTVGGAADGGGGGAGTVQVRPDPSALPGGAQWQQLVNGFAGFALLGLAATTVGGAVWWAGAAASGNNYGGVAGGKRMVLISLVGALVVGASAALVNFFRALGGQVR